MNIKSIVFDIPMLLLLAAILVLPFYIQLNSLLTVGFVVFSFLLYFKKIIWSDFAKLQFIVPFALYVLIIYSGIKSVNQELGLDLVARKSFILFLPFSFIIIKHKLKEWIPKIFSVFILSNFLALCISLFNSTKEYYSNQDINVFIHSNLTSTIEIQSTYLALYLLISVFIIYFSNKYKIALSCINKRLKVFLIMFFSIGIVLLSARILYIPFLVFFLYVFYYSLKQKKNVYLKIFSLVLISSFVLSILKIPQFNDRIQEIKNTDFEVLRLEEFEHDTPLNGLTLRLLFFKMGHEVLQNENKFLFGVGIGDVQKKMQTIFKKYNLYTGNPKIKDTGYFHYNMHNQYSQTVMQTGILGLLLLLILFVIMMHQNMNELSGFIVISYILLFMVESVFERQFGLSHIFTFYSILSLVDLKTLKVS